MSEDFIVSLLAAAITMGTPLLYAALGEVICERSGVINLGVEGMMLIGACTGFIAGNSFGSPWAGVAAAVAAGALLALIHAFLTVTLRANQVVSGLAVTLFGTGLSGLTNESGCRAKSCMNAQPSKPSSFSTSGRLSSVPMGTVLIRNPS